VQSGRRRVVWTAEKSFHSSALKAELEAFGLLSKRKKKYAKTYYRCAFKKRFNCAFVIRTVREVVTGHVVIKTCSSDHFQNESEEQFHRGLTKAIEERIEEIAKFNLRIRLQCCRGH
jgi:hypothetical protein